MEMDRTAVIEMYKGIETVFSVRAVEIMPDEEDRTLMLDHFFRRESINSITWVTTEELQRSPEVKLPMYTMSNGGGDKLLLWPMLKGSDLCLFVESAEDRTDLIGEL